MHLDNEVLQYELYTGDTGWTMILLKEWTSLIFTVWVKKKSPPAVFWNLFPNGWEFLNNFLHTYYAIISTLKYKFLFKYLQLSQSYAILSATT